VGGGLEGPEKVDSHGRARRTAATVDRGVHLPRRGVGKRRPRRKKAQRPGIRRRQQGDFFQGFSSHELSYLVHVYGWMNPYVLRNRDKGEISALTTFREKYDSDQHWLCKAKTFLSLTRFPLVSRGARRPWRRLTDARRRGRPCSSWKTCGAAW